MNTLKRQLTLKDGIPLAFGSIIGSGILFLPSLTFAISGPYTLWVWIITTLLCVPLVYIFIDMVKEIPNESGIEGFISCGLGKRVGATLPILFLGTISFGMPASALIVGEYVKHLIGGGTVVQMLTAFFIVLCGVATNITGIKIGSKIQLLISFLICIIAISLFIFAFPTKFGQGAFVPSSKNMMLIVPGIVMAFWAFAGFENLTFIAGEFKNPARDFKLSMFIALFLAGLLYLLLSESCATHVPHNQINPIVGLYQLAETIHPKIVTTTLITVFAFLAVQINFNSWIWGISRLIYSSAEKNKLPRYFSILNSKSIPERAIMLLAGLFFLVLLGSLLFPTFLKVMLIIVSTNFIFIYILCLMSYLFFKKQGLLTFIAMLLLVLLVLLFLSSKWLILYPVFLFSMGLFINYFFNGSRGKL